MTLQPKISFINDLYKNSNDLFNDIILALKCIMYDAEIICWKSEVVNL